MAALVSASGVLV